MGHMEDEIPDWVITIVLIMFPSTLGRNLIFQETRKTIIYLHLSANFSCRQVERFNPPEIPEYARLFEEFQTEFLGFSDQRSPKF